MVGMETPWGDPFIIEKGTARKFAQAILDTNAPYANHESDARIPVPHSILICNMPSGSELDFKIPLPTTRRIRGEDQLEICQPIHIGDAIKAKSKILDIYEKEGRSGRMVFIITETEYLNQTNDIVMKSRTLVIKR